MPGRLCDRRPPPMSRLDHVPCEPGEPARRPCLSRGEERDAASQTRDTSRDAQQARRAITAPGAGTKAAAATGQADTRHRAAPQTHRSRCTRAYSLGARHAENGIHRAGRILAVPFEACIRMLLRKSATGLGTTPAPSRAGSVCSLPAPVDLSDVGDTLRQVGRPRPPVRDRCESRHCGLQGKSSRCWWIPGPAASIS